MNYIRGAVNAISAPYQYYKDLPPLNPSTLTGAIDVIVIQRPTDSGDIELVCSPFHVRFGKWQVLRPGEKKVNVTVNGHPIPFNMKIGEAGEAFFVFETDDDVPDNLITSPIIQPTHPDDSASKDTGRPSDTPGAKQDPDGDHGIESGQRGRTSSEGVIRGQAPDTQEPDFLDLDAPPIQEDEGPFKHAHTARAPITPKPVRTSVPEPAQTLPSPPPSPPHAYHTHPPTIAAQDQRVDEALKAVRDNLYVPEVDYHHDIALDVEGYHAHGREKSDQTVRSSEQYSFPSSSKTTSSTPSPMHGLPHTQSLQHSSSVDTQHVFPTFRATSEPPPDTDEHEPLPQNSGSSHPTTKLAILTPVQEYSWEWGAFPQPSPMKTSFGKGGRIEGGAGRPWGKGKGKGKSKDLPSLSPVDFGEEEEGETEHGRSQSVPPELEGSPTRLRKNRELVEDYEIQSDEEPEIVGFGDGGWLGASKAEPTRFILSIEGKKVAFELSLVPPEEGSEPEDSGPEKANSSIYTRGRKDRGGGRGGVHVLSGRDEVEVARLFSQGKIDFRKFLSDDELVDDPRLVIRWAGDQYITRSDGSPLMHALPTWRNATLLRQDNRIPSRSSSPQSDGESEESAPPLPPSPSPSADEREHDQEYDRQAHGRSKSEPPEKTPVLNGKPTSSSWVQWWSRSRRNTHIHTNTSTSLDSTKGTSERPGLHSTTSAPIENGIPGHSNNLKLYEMRRISREIPPAESAPALPSTPVQRPVTNIPLVTPVPEKPVVRRKFAKTLRLTSEQLKALNLKPGANTITFSLSTSGVIACTARIFVWDSTDLVVVSDIDGTITKSDGLGHVFAMIGRDWTHLGVAKLYTDITRNGYKIMYLTSRAIGQADATRDYLKGIKQNDYQLPEGPVIMSPDRLMASLHREVIMRKPEVFKMACLRDIQRLFGEASRNPFYAGFGNRITDALSYRSVSVPSARIFTIDSSGEVKMELLELAGYKSSYIHMTDLVDQMFPPIHRKWAPEFTDFNYWKVPVQDFPLPDFSPPSPALSARSDTSNQSTLARLRNFRLVGSRQGTIRQSNGDASASEHDLLRATHLRQISSFEKLGNTLGFAQGSHTVNGHRRSTSPESRASTLYDSDDEDGDESNVDADGKRPRRERRRSMTSMPGSLDDMHFGMDYDDEPHSGEEESEGEGKGELEDDMLEDMGDAEDEAFDEDLMAAVEMKNVPFL